jgi:hypothetical protein
MLISSGLVKRLFYFLAKKRRGVGGGNSETNSRQSEPIGDGKNFKIKRPAINWSLIPNRDDV